MWRLRCHFAVTTIVSSSTHEMRLYRSHPSVAKISRAHPVPTLGVVSGMNISNKKVLIQKEYYYINYKITNVIFSP